MQHSTYNFENIAPGDTLTKIAYGDHQGGSKTNQIIVAALAAWIKYKLYPVILTRNATSDKEQLTQRQRAFTEMLHKLPGNENGDLLDIQLFSALDSFELSVLKNAEDRPNVCPVYVQCFNHTSLKELCDRDFCLNLAVIYDEADLVFRPSDSKSEMVHGGKLWKVPFVTFFTATPATIYLARDINLCPRNGVFVGERLQRSPYYRGLPCQGVSLERAVTFEEVTNGFQGVYTNVSTSLEVRS